MTRIELFPTQTETDGLFVIVLFPTGIVYVNQCGGTGCDEMEAEGFLVPVGRPEHLVAIKNWFRRRFGESCWCDGRLAASIAYHGELAQLVAALECWKGNQLVPLEIDVERLSGACEAWVSVKSCFGPGWLTWTNSD